MLLSQFLFPNTLRNDFQKKSCVTWQSQNQQTMKQKTYFDPIKVLRETGILCPLKQHTQHLQLLLIKSVVHSKLTIGN